jgi:hypothetical protein
VRRVLKWLVLAVTGVGVAIGLTVLAAREPDAWPGDGRIFELWLLTVIWVVACVAAIWVENGRRK